MMRECFLSASEPVKVCAGDTPLPYCVENCEFVEFKKHSVEGNLFPDYKLSVVLF